MTRDIDSRKLIYRVKEREREKDHTKVFCDNLNNIHVTQILLYIDGM